MAIRTKIIVQQILNIDDTTTTASKYPKYTVVLGNSISSITAGELTAAVEASAASAAAAKDSEIAAKISETNAKDSEIQAGIHADASEASATQSAASSAESERQADLSKQSAENSATSAEESKGFKDAAELAAQNAEQSRLLAEQAKNAAQAAQTAAETAKAGAETAETNAGAFATTAGEHAEAAKQSELNAKTSETNAAASEGEAANQAVNATTEADRAKAEADRASQVVDGKLDKVDISGFIKVYKTKEEADADVVNRVLDEKVLVWNQTDFKYGWYKVAGTSESPVLELLEIEQKLKSVNNVRADDAGNVQITLPGGNPSLWLGEVTWFPYDKDSGVGYPGVLPADGREVLRIDYPDTWEAIEAGLIPSVSEAEWQAGATLYFSTGDGSTTFRLPDMMQGQAFRAPTKGEEDAGVVKDQIPYITTVNGIAPEDATGAIVLPYIAVVNGNIRPDESGNLSLGNVVTKNVWDGTSGEVLLRGAFGIGGSGIQLNEPDLVSFFKTCRSFGSGYYRNDTAIDGLPAYSAGFYSKVADTHSFVCPQYSSGIMFVGTINDAVLDGENPTVHTNILYGTANKPNLNNDTEGTLSISRGGTGAENVTQAKINLQVDKVIQLADQSNLASGNGNMKIYVKDNGEWGVWDSASAQAIALLIERGGTGATTVGGARSNLNTPVGGNAVVIPNNSNVLSFFDISAESGYYSSGELITFQPPEQSGWWMFELHVHGKKPDGTLAYGNVVATSMHGNKWGIICNNGSWGGWTRISRSDNSMVLADGNIPNGLGTNSLVIGDADTGIKWVGDGAMQFICNGRATVGLNSATAFIYNSMEVHPVAGNNANGIRIAGAREGGGNAMLGGQVAGGAFAAWRDRAAGLLVELPADDIAVNIVKSVRWGGDWVFGIDVARYGNGGCETHLNVRGTSYVFNDAGYASAVQWVSTSDIRLKTQLKEITSAREKIKSLQGYTYFKRSNLEEDEHSFYSEEAGLIAQDVATVLPEAVYKVSNTDYLGISYSGVTALLTNAFNELSDEFDKQKEELGTVKAELAELKALVATLVNK